MLLVPNKVCSTCNNGIYINIRITCQNKKNEKTNPDPLIGSHRTGRTVIGSCGPPGGALCTCRDTGRSAGHMGSVAPRTGCLQEKGDYSRSVFYGGIFTPVHVNSKTYKRCPLLPEKCLKRNPM